jgi:hypothetical protein
MSTLLSFTKVILYQLGQKKKNSMQLLWLSIGKHALFLVSYWLLTVEHAIFLISYWLMRYFAFRLRHQLIFYWLLIVEHAIFLVFYWLTHDFCFFDCVTR